MSMRLGLGLINMTMGSRSAVVLTVIAAVVGLVIISS